ncbi:hypothetical protein LTR36_000449 [Oleoguttula mirabilis]|uniref:Uncharacterized protein n=1 Tax=Oleoguttula mirabilis TaxID=1507867 RepID=A0AAV9JYY8_9PEZI|nr:hypothetical protein LTR36_000449 [Oleoguttula mirabilis]
MRSQSVINGLACLTALSYASPIASPADDINSPEERRNILVPGELIPTTTVNPATWSAGPWTGTPDFMPTSLVVLGRRDLASYPDLVPTSEVNPATWTPGPWTGTPKFLPTKLVTQAKRDLTSYPDLVPTSEVDPATWVQGVWTGTPKFLPTKLVTQAKRDLTSYPDLVPTSEVNPATWVQGVWTGTPKFLPTKLVTQDKRDLTSYPDLVPTSTVDIATDSTGVAFTGTPKFMPTKVVRLGTTTGCVVSIATHTHSSTVEYSYATHCSDGATATEDALLVATGIAGCCGGEDSLHACMADGSLPTGPTAWTCTLGSSSYAGVTTATTTWA